MASNIVEILIGAKDDAKLDLDSLRARLDELAHKVADARVNVNGDKEAELALDRLGVKLTRLGDKTSKPSIKLDGALKVDAELGAIDLALDHVGKKAGNETTGLLSKLSSSMTSLGASMGPALQGLPLVGQGLASIAESGPVGVAALAALAVAFGAVVTAMGPLILSLGIITAGIAGFAALAVPEITKVWTAVSKGGAALKALNPQEKALAGPIESLRDQFGKLSKAVQPQILKAFGDGLKIIKSLMPALTPLLTAAGKAIDGLLQNIEKWLRSPAGQKFIKWLSTEAPVALRDFSGVVWRVTRDFGSAMEDWWKAGSWLIRNLMAGWRVLQAAFVAVWHAIYQDIQALVADFDWLKEPGHPERGCHGQRRRGCLGRDL